MKKNIRTYHKAECDFSGSEKMCIQLDKAGVPHDSRWRVLMLSLYCAENDVSLLPSQQKELYALFEQTIQSNDYSDEALLRTAESKNAILFDPVEEKLQSALSETAELVEDMQKILHARKGEVQELETFTIDGIREGKDPELLVSQLRSSFAELIDVIEKDSERLSYLSFTDSLTKMNNRRSFDEHLEKLLSQCKKNEEPLCLLMLDIDHFKDFNDTYGHRIGDQALSVVASIIKQQVEKLSKEEERDFFSARYGGEEFTVLLPGMDSKDAYGIAEVVRNRVENYNFIIRDADNNVIHKGIKLTISIGVAELLSDWGSNLQVRLIEAADKALYAAKENGRNCTIECDSVLLNS